MKLRQNGLVLETDNEFVIEQLLKYGAEEVKEQKPKKGKKKEA